MIKKISTLMFLFAVNFTYCQEVCIKLDSIIVTYIPLNGSTIIWLDENAIRSFEKSSVITKVIKDSIVLSKFSEIDLWNKKDLNEKNGLIDARMILDLHFKSGMILTLIVAAKTYYQFNRDVYYLNDDLISWINLFILSNEKLVKW